MSLYGRSKSEAADQQKLMNSQPPSSSLLHDDTVIPRLLRPTRGLRRWVYYSLFISSRKAIYQLSAVFARSIAALVGVYGRLNKSCDRATRNTRSAPRSRSSG
ncbi:hypothetical protein J6590_001582 [Homalodisca vitripennis]|nr:hypothetical protein J6590_001582 [Homalodisca vitripennis]